jgi:gliding motility-associated-like protein
MVMRDDASGLQYATFVGGNGGPAGDHVDGGTSRFDRKGVVYQSVCESCGGNSNFPTFPANCVSPTNKSNNCNNLLFKFDLDIPLTIADFSVPKGCNATNIPFTNLSKRVSGLAQYFWDFGDGTKSNLDNPTHLYTNEGTYIVKLKLIDSSSCNISDSTQQTIVIQTAKNSTLPTVTICNSDSAQIGIAPSSDPNAIYSWTPPTFLNNPTISNPYSSADTNTLYKLFYNHDYCIDTFAQQVNVFFDSIKVTGGKILCPKDTVRLFTTNAVSGNTFTYSWTPASQIIFGANTANPLCAPIKDTTFIVTATDSRGCIYKDSFFVKVASPLGSIASIAIPDTINFGDTSQIQTTYPPEAVRFQWDNASTLTAIDTPNPRAFPKETTTYTLSSKDSNGCRLRSDVKIVVLRKPCASSNIYVPNAFSPNNDGKNDVLYLRGNFIQTIYFAVYDRWGQLVFETRDQNKGWDGVFKNSKLDPAVFGYYAEGTCVGDEKFFKKGNVTLLK